MTSARSISPRLDGSAVWPTDIVPSSPLLDVGTLVQLLGSGQGVRLVDVRWALDRPDGRADHRAGHIPGSAYADLETELASPTDDPRDGRHPLPDLAALERAARRWGIHDGDTVVFYDAGPSLSAARAWWLLRHAGLTRVYVLDGGLAGWLAQGFEIARGDEVVEAGDVVLPGYGSLGVLDADQAAARARTGVLLDARAVERYRGESEPVDPRAGHIPGAVSAPTAANVGQDGRLLSPEVLRRRFEALGVRPGVAVGVYCGSGVTAAHQILALETAGFEADLYAASWSGWSSEPHRPVAVGSEPGHEAGRRGGPDLVSRLRAKGLVLDTRPSALEASAVDRSGLAAKGRPLAVARPRSVTEVIDVLRSAHQTRTPVVVRGAGTGLAGGATAESGAIVLETTALNRIVELRPDERRAVVEPGVLTADLDRAAREHGLRYTPDPASFELSTIGGNIATNAGGLRCTKYGVTGDAVLALDVVLADGTLVRTGSPVAKSVAGYDLNSLFIGSEGTLGVIVGATVRLDIVPEETATAAAYFASAREAALAASAVAVSGLRPSMLELLDAATLEAIDRRSGTRLRSQGAAFILAQTDGLAASLEIERIERVLREHGGRVTTPADPDAADRLVSIRRQALPAVEALGRPFIEDIAVPVSRLADAIEALDEISRTSGLPIFVFAHAAEGNLHPIVLAEPDPVMGDDGVRVMPARVAEVVDKIFALAIGLGGTITAEHGVGALKRSWLARQVGPEVLALHTAIKKALDPAGILNPGKAF